MPKNIDISNRLIDEIQNAVKPEVIEVKHGGFVTKPVYQAALPDLPKVLIASSLSALADYINNQADYDSKDPDPFLVSIVSPTSVHVLGWFDDWNRREHVLSANAIVGNFQFGQFVSLEQFIIALQSQFAETDQLLAVIRSCSYLTDSSVFTFADDGVTQVTSGKIGIAREGQIDLPRIVELRPYSTFRDCVRQPDRKFLLRLKKNSNENQAPLAALFEADGGLWANDAIALIKSYLEEAIEEGKAVIIG